MRCLSASGVYLGIMKSQPGNIPGGTLTFYLVATAGATARGRDDCLGGRSFPCDLPVRSGNEPHGSEARPSPRALLFPRFCSSACARA